MSNQPGNKGARGRYATWWNTKRVQEGLTYNEMFELLGNVGYSSSYITNCFIGKAMPVDDLIVKIADAFDITFDEAKSHFFNDWGGNKSKIPVGDMIIAPKTETVKQKEEAMDYYKTGMLDRESILKKVYGAVDFDTYLTIDEALLVGSSKDVLKNIYGKISFDAYQEVLKCL